MRLLADFVLDSDLCLAAETSSLTLNGTDGSYLALSNAEHDNALKTSVLSAQLNFESESFDGVRENAIQLLDGYLNCLAYSTNRKFLRVTLKRIIDWTAGTIDRRALVYLEKPEWDVAEPKLSGALSTTAERILAMSQRDEAKVAMKWYRRGVGAPFFDEQFSYFWFALEIASEAMKGPEKVTSKCPHCRSALYCEKCEKHPVHRRYPGEAILQMIERVHPHGSQEIFETLQTIRHALMHGGNISKLIADLPCTQEEAINKLASITWNAISRMFDMSHDPKPDDMLDFGHPGTMARRLMVAWVDVTTRMPGDPNNPQLAQFPKVDLSVSKRVKTEAEIDPSLGPNI